MGLLSSVSTELFLLASTASLVTVLRSAARVALAALRFARRWKRLRKRAQRHSKRSCRGLRIGSGVWRCWYSEKGWYCHAAADIVRTRAAGIPARASSSRQIDSSDSSCSRVLLLNLSACIPRRRLTRNHLPLTCTIASKSLFGQ